MSVSIEGPVLGQAALCEPILRELPDWFGIEDAIVHYVKVIDEMPTLLARCDGNVVGFLTIKKHNQVAAEIYVMAIRQEHHRSNIGTDLVRKSEQLLSAEGVKFLQVKTVGPSRPDTAYDGTRSFYEATGFHPVEEFKSLWPGNPCLLMIKTLP